MATENYFDYRYHFFKIDQSPASSHENLFVLNSNHVIIATYPLYNGGVGIKVVDNNFVISTEFSIPNSYERPVDLENGEIFQLFVREYKAGIGVVDIRDFRRGYEPIERDIILHLDYCGAKISKDRTSRFFIIEVPMGSIPGEPDPLCLTISPVKKM